MKNLIPPLFARTKELLDQAIDKKARAILISKRGPVALMTTGIEDLSLPEKLVDSIQTRLINIASLPVSEQRNFLFGNGRRTNKCKRLKLSIIIVPPNRKSSILVLIRH